MKKENLFYYVSAFFSYHSANLLLLMLSILGFPYIAYHAAIIASIFSVVLSLFNAESNNKFLTKKTSSFGINEISIFNRILFLPCLALAGTVISLSYSKYSRILIAAIIFRKCFDWIDELLLVKHTKERPAKITNYLSSQFILYIVLLFFVFRKDLIGFNTIYWILGLWAITPLFLLDFKLLGNALRYFKALIRNIRNASFKKIHIAYDINLSYYFTSFILTGSTLIFRLNLSHNSNDINAGNLISAYAAGGFISALAAGPIGSFYAHNSKIKNNFFRKEYILFIPIILGLITCYSIKEIDYLGKDTTFWKTLIYTFSASPLMAISQIKRHRRIQNNLAILKRDILTSLTTLSIAIFFIHNSFTEALAMFFTISAITNYYFYAKPD
jgi:hypothetical protein